MANSFRFVFLVLSVALPFAAPAILSLNQGSSLSVEDPSDVLVSSNGVFSAGFYAVGENAYCFAIWFTTACHDGRKTIVWMANRDEPVNGRHSKLSILKNCSIILTDAGKSTVWSTDKVSDNRSQLQLHNSGNLVLQTSEGDTIWQSFDSPTDTLLPEQQLRRDTLLVSVRSKSNFSSGYYKLLYDYNNVLRILFDSPGISSVYWPDPHLLDYQQGRSRYNDTRIAVFDSSGNFASSDKMGFRSADFGKGPRRRLTLDFDGNLRLYSFEKEKREWTVTWQAISTPCRIHGACGPYSICKYDPVSGRSCFCPQGYKMINKTDWSYGCKPKVELSCKNQDVNFVKLRHVDFFGYNYQIIRNCSLRMCVKNCLKWCCKGFQYQFLKQEGVYQCYLKSQLRNGHLSHDFNGTFFLKLPKSEAVVRSGYAEHHFHNHLNCSSKQVKVLQRAYYKKAGNGSWKVLVWPVCVIAFVEIISVLGFLYRTRQYSNKRSRQGYHVAATEYKKFTYRELKKATGNFSEEVGRGGSGIVYKGVLSDQRTAAIKHLNVADQGHEVFLAEVSIIGRINHMNMIKLLGYCAEGKHRLLVYEFMEHGSLAENLISNSLDWKKRFEIAVGTAKGLAYLHEECLEWILHCDVKPKNILLSSDYQPKISDFGLSKLLNRDVVTEPSVSKVRGTRGYMAPEWVLNQCITSKVDVYSFGVVVLEMVTRRNPTCGVSIAETDVDADHHNVVEWIREKKNRAIEKGCDWVEESIDPAMGNEYDRERLQLLLEVAIKCTEIDKDARPSMSQVAQMLGDQIET